MRTTQYVGLNQYALNYVKGAVRTETYNMTEGMFMEPVVGTIYHMPVPNGPNKAYILKEVVQCAPWSSGPVIFTCLEATLVKESGQKLDWGKMFKWIRDPSLGEEHKEYDKETGRYWV